MLQHALSEEGKLLYINDTTSGPYFCPECLGPLGKKLGPQRTWHFFHSDTETTAPHPCKKREDGSHHYLLQLLVKDHFSKTFSSPIEIEYPVPAAKRIADLAIPTDKIAIEIQRSSLCFDQLQERTEAYWKQEWHVLWLIAAPLWQIDSMPRRLQEYGQIPHYLFEEKGKQIELWDTLSYEKNAIERPLHTFVLKRRQSHTTVSCLEKRQNWTVHMEGDFLDNPPTIKTATEEQDRIHKSLRYLKLLWFKCISSGN